MRQAALSIDQVVFKGSHNSYDCRRDASLRSQLDDFGCWAIELDFSVPLLGDQRAVVGHEGSGMAADGEDVCGGDGSASNELDRFRILHFLREIAGSKSIRYRPVFVYFE